MLLDKHKDQPTKLIENGFKINLDVRRGTKWQCSLAESLIGDFLVTPMTSVKMLKAESDIMANDLIGYAQRCVNQDYCVFSIRTRAGERLATLGVVYTDAYWKFDWCSGPAKSEILEESMQYLDDEGKVQTESHPTDFYYIAHEVVRMMNAGSLH